MTEHDEDGYEGPAELLDGDRVIDVEVKLAGHFDPISGKYSWYGRVAASDTLAAFMATAPRSVVLRTPFAQVETALSDIDPWGRPRVEGFGATPFEVLDHLR